MKREDFEELKKSVVEAGRIRRGESRAAREVTREAPATTAPAARVLAVCVETDDEGLLVPRKIYEAEVTAEYARVTDEAGDSAVYPATFFVPLNLPAEVGRRILRLS